MDVGIYGGSFNPPHVAHLVVAETMREQFALDHVLWIPSFRPPHKENHALAPIEDRLTMARLATAGNPAFRVSDIEQRLGGVSYTISTIEALQEENPGTRFHLIVGGDSMLQFNTWYRPDEIVRRVPLLVYRRPGSDLTGVEPRFTHHARFAVAPMLEISGEALRARIKSGMSIRYLVPDAVREYITEHQLYI